MRKKDKIELSITGVLVLVLLFFGINAITSVKKTGRRLRPNKVIVVDPVESRFIKDELQNDSGKELFRQLEEESVKLELKRDPFFSVALAPVKACPHGLCLKGIVWDDEMPTAIINDTIVGKGDKIGGSIVIKIEPDKVILNDGKIDFNLAIEFE